MAACVLVSWAFISLTLFSATGDDEPSRACQLEDDEECFDDHRRTQGSSMLQYRSSTASAVVADDYYDADVSPAAPAALATLHAPATAIADVDFAYCWGGSGCTGGSMDHDAACDNGELKVSLRSLARFAPWARKIFVLMDPPARAPHWFNSTDGLPAVEFVDRCTLFDEKADCPTSNSEACQTVMHHIPGLAEHFIVMDDDLYLVSPVNHSDFFAADGRPYVPNKPERVPTYTNQWMINEEIPAKVPRRINWIVHSPMAMPRSFLLQFESEYSDWFRFVRSHTKRYDGGGSSLDELVQRIYDAQLLDRKAGVPSASFQDGFCEFEPGSEQKGLTCLKNKLGKVKFVNTNNVGTKEMWSTIERLLESAGGSNNSATDASVSLAQGAARRVLARVGVGGATPHPDDLLDAVRAILEQHE